MESTGLDGFCKLGSYREKRSHVFPSDNALQWFVRKHRAELIKAGALLMHTGQWHAVDQKFDAFVLEAGRRAALRHGEVSAR